jgi:hypothetical protein
VGWDIELRKDAIRMPTLFTYAEGYMDGNDSASSRTILRSRRPQSTPRNFMHENGETSEISAIDADRRTAGEGQGRTARMYVFEESDSGVVPMNHSNKDRRLSAESEEGRPLIKENTHQLHTFPTQSGIKRVPGVGECAAISSAVAARSKIGAVCANERSYGSVRGVPGDWYPYRDLRIPNRALMHSLRNLVRRIADSQRAGIRATPSSLTRC